MTHVLTNRASPYPVAFRPARVALAMWRKSDPRQVARIEDTAAALGISVGTAKSRLNRAMAKLRVALRHDVAARSSADKERVA